MSVQNNGSSTPGGVTGRGFLPGQSGNPGGRPRGLAAAARAALGSDGDDLVAFFSAIMRGDRKFLAERRPIALRDRMQAATWLADRAYGKPPQTVAVADLEREQREQNAAALQGAADLPEHLKAEIRAWLTERREQYLAEQRAEAEARMRCFLPNPEAVNRDGAR